MGSIFSSMWGLLVGRRPYKLLIVGLNNAGKTSILYALQLKRHVVTQPTIGSNAEEIRTNNVTFLAWDLGGQEALRETWSVYYQRTDAVIFVVDSAETARFGVARRELAALLADPQLEKASVLVLANKQDVAGAASPEEVALALGLGSPEMLGGRADAAAGGGAAAGSARQWAIFGCSAVTQAGLPEAMSWVTDHLPA